MATNLTKFVTCVLLGTSILAGCSDDDDPSNRPPVANAGTAQSVKVGQAVALDGSKSADPDGDPLTFKWAFTKQPQNSALEIKETTNKVNVTPAVAGEYEVELTVSDGRASVKATVKITVQT